MAIPPTIEAAAAEGWTGLRVTCATHGVKSVAWSALAPDGNRRVSLSAVVIKLRCSECRQPPDKVELESESGTVEIIPSPGSRRIER